MTEPAAALKCFEQSIVELHPGIGVVGVGKAGVERVMLIDETKRRRRRLVRVHVPTTLR